MQKISEPAKRRLVLLASFLSRCGERRITSIKIQEATAIERDLIRKDISAIGFGGGTSGGYDTQELLRAIREALDIPRENEVRLCCIAGLGRLGVAVMQSGIFEGTPFKIAAGFDSNVNRVEILRTDFPLYPAAKMQSVISQEKIRLAILAAEESQVAALTERLVKSGVKGIVNFTNEIIRVPKGVFVENVSPIFALNNLLANCSSDKGNL